MPACPELLNALREKRLPEIFRQAHAEHLCTAEHHIHCARKLHIELTGIAYHCKCDNAAVIVCMICKNSFDQDVQAVGNHNFLHHAEQDALHAEGQPLPGKRAPFQSACAVCP